MRSSSSSWRGWWWMDSAVTAAESIHPAAVQGPLLYRRPSPRAADRCRKPRHPVHRSVRIDPDVSGNRGCPRVRAGDGSLRPASKHDRPPRRRHRKDDRRRCDGSLSRSRGRAASRTRDSGNFLGSEPAGTSAQHQSRTALGPPHRSNPERAPRLFRLDGQHRFPRRAPAGRWRHDCVRGRHS